MPEEHLTADDMPLFTRLRMTAFGEAVIDIANDPAYDQWTFSAKIRHALEHETAARTERRVLKLLKASGTPNPAACVEDIRYLQGRSLNRDVIARLAACRWIDQTHNLVILGRSSVGKSYLAQALVNAACRRDYTATYFRLDDLANRLVLSVALFDDFGVVLGDDVVGVTKPPARGWSGAVVVGVAWCSSL